MKITNIVELRNEMSRSYENHSLGKLDNETLKNKANMAGKLMASAKLEIEHQRLVKTHVLIPWLTSKEVQEEYNDNKKK